MTLQDKRTTQSAILSQFDADEEIQKFVKAVSSYPARFASNPEITFEQHLLHVSEKVEENIDEQTSGD
jgi:hypothetical protein